jgi:SAM-dependent MidA family methyltransferase
MARRIEQMWVGLGKPSPFTLVEYGAGSGTLGLSLFEGFRIHATPDSLALLEAARYQPIESNPHRVTELQHRFERARLAERLVLPSSGSPADQAASDEAEPVSQDLLADERPVGVEPVSGVVIANEFLDALPVHRFIVRGPRLFELFVTWRNEGRNHAAGFVEFVAEPSTPELAQRLADDGIDVGHLAEGQIGEISLGLGEWLAQVAARLGRGYVLVIDYGHEAGELYGPRRLAGTLLGYRGHRVETDPFTTVGLTDLTAHVDFTALRLLGERHGFRTLSQATQSEFLITAGLEAELQALQASPDTALPDYLRARSGIVRMLDPRHMGRFRVLTLGRGVEASTSGTKASIQAGRPG